MIPISKLSVKFIPCDTKIALVLGYGVSAVSHTIIDL